MILFTYDRVGPPLDDHSPATYLYWSGPSAAAASTTPSATSRPVSLEPSLDARSCSSPTWASRRTSGLHTRSMRPSLGCGQNAASFLRAHCATYQSPSVRDMAQSCPTPSISEMCSTPHWKWDRELTSVRPWKTIGSFPGPSQYAKVHTACADLSSKPANSL